MKNATIFRELEIIDAIDFKRQKTNYYTNKRNFSVLSIRVSGEAEFTSGSTVKVTDKNILFIPKNIGYSQSTEGEHVLTVHLKGKFPYDDITVFDIESDEVKKLFFDMVKLFRMKTETGFYMAHCKLYEIMTIISKRMTGDKIRDKITAGYEEIQMNYSSPELRLEDIVKEYGISSVYFRREFKKRYGILPKQMIINLRLNNGAMLLENGYCNVSEAALQSGFSDPNYFSAVFKKRYGMSPLEYMKRLSPINYVSDKNR